MSEQKHTPEPWRHDYANTLNVYPQGDCGLVYEICKFPDTARGAEDLRRTMACVNACAGVATEELEEVIFKQNVNEVFSREMVIGNLRDERDELLAALKRLKAAERAPRTEWEAALVHADEAIAKVEPA